MGENCGLAGKLRSVLLAMICSSALAGCFDDGSNGADESASGPQASASANPPRSEAESPLANHPPEITGQPPTSITAGEQYSFTPNASDPDNDFLEFTIENKPNWATFNTATGTLVGVPDDTVVGDSADITITVTDGRDSRSIGPFKIRVNPRNMAPLPSNNAPSITGVPPTSVVVGQSYVFLPNATDADGDRLSFAITNQPSWTTFSTATGQLSGTPSSANVGTYSNIVISVSDGRATAVLPAFTIQVTSANRAPSISGTPPTTLQPGQSYSFRPTASDPDGDSLTYSITNKPRWASFNNLTGQLSGTPTPSHVGTYSNIVISVSDGKASASLPAFTINVQGAANRAPTISGNPPTSVMAGSTYSFTPTATDQDNDMLAFSIENRPTWATFNTSTGALTGTPTSAGTHSNIVITVSDGKATASLGPFSITVTANGAPTISGSPATSVVVGHTYVFQPTASDPEGSPLTFSVQNLPVWASFNTSTGRISGTPTSSHVGTYGNIVVRVTDGLNTTSLPAFSINVTNPAVGDAFLSWQPPTQNTDGSALTNLAGYRVHYGSSPSTLNQVITINNPSITSYVVNNLSAGTHYFAVTAFTTSGSESALSNIASKTIQ